jgi:hypothetical protein
LRLSKVCRRSPCPSSQTKRKSDEIEGALEKDFNDYLTVIDKGYVADTDQMLFKVGFGGLGVKRSTMTR